MHPAIATMKRCIASGLRHPGRICDEAERHTAQLASGQQPHGAKYRRRLGRPIDVQSGPARRGH